MKLMILLLMTFGILPIMSTCGNAADPTAAAPQTSSPWWESHLAMLKNNYNYQSSAPVLLIRLDEQKMYKLQADTVQQVYTISASKLGAGSKSGSGKTPLGVHRVSEKYGQQQPKGMIFKGRMPTGQVADIITEPKDVEADHVTSRILWLDGLEPGKNQGGNVDSHSRYIYIHGTHEEGLLGQPASHGCIRMYNDEVIKLFDQIPLGTLVYILNKA